MPNSILTVDDSSTIRKIVGQVAAVLGYELLEAEDGQMALDTLETHSAEVALIILDVNMPVMDGETALHRIKGDPRFQHIPVMMLTTESEGTRVLGFIQAGAANYLMKPFSDDDLTAKIASCLGLGF
ncbi:MAG: response regulator [Acidobacteria bacterium]|nr:response regulator [Acidobacteriota bacterium]